MPAVLPSTPLARPDDGILELPGLLFSTFWSICNYCWSFLLVIILYSLAVWSSKRRTPTPDQTALSKNEPAKIELLGREGLLPSQLVSWPGRTLLNVPLYASWCTSSWQQGSRWWFRVSLETTLLG